MSDKEETVVFTCPRCGCHKLQYKTLTPAYEDIETITREPVNAVFPLNRHDLFHYEGYTEDSDIVHDYDGEIDAGVECAECGMSWKDVRQVAMAGHLQVPCGGVGLEEGNNKPIFKLDRQMTATHILGMNRDRCLVVLTHLTYNFPSLHDARVAVMKPMTMKDVEDARTHTEPEMCRQYWKDAVAAGDTDESLEQFSDTLKARARYGDTLFVGDDAYMRRDTIKMLLDLPHTGRNLLLQAMEVASPELPDSDGVYETDSRGNIPVVAFSCEWTGNLEPSWMEDMSAIVAGKDVLSIVNAYAGTEPMSEERNSELREKWSALCDTSAQTDTAK